MAKEGGKEEYPQQANGRAAKLSCDQSFRLVLGKNKATGNAGGGGGGGGGTE